ncbi:MAG: hypothetical protein R3E96_15640, partial [Planctomycetota bacterium]
MADNPQGSIRSALLALQDLVLDVPALRGEWADAWREFSQDACAIETAEQGSPESFGRFREWFLLERHSQELAGTPMDRLIGPWRDAVGSVAAWEETLQSSSTGIFEVTASLPGEGCKLRDVTGLTDLFLFEPAGSTAFEVGDLLVGRLFALGDGRRVASGHATVI